MRFLILIATIATFAVVGLVATGNLSIGNAAADGTSDTVTTPQTGADETALQPAPAGKSIGICDDPTASTDPAFAKSIIASTIHAVENYVPIQPAETKNGVPAVSGLDLTIRLVSTRPLSYGQPYLNIQIPSVAGLPARPDMTAAGALDPGGPYLAWKKSEERWAADYRASLALAATAVKRLGTIDLSNPSRSGVRECVAALVSVPPKYSNATLVVASDLGDNSFTGANPNFDAKPMLLIQPCSGNAKKCTRLQEDFTAWAANHGAGPTTASRPEDAPNTLAQLITSTD